MIEIIIKNDKTLNFNLDLICKAIHKLNLDIYKIRKITVAHHIVNFVT